MMRRLAWSRRRDSGEIMEPGACCYGHYVFVMWIFFLAFVRFLQINKPRPPATVSYPQDAPVHGKCLWTCGAHRAEKTKSCKWISI